ncbi:hypothetical protein [Limnoglobus roseus]|uniref:SMI1/KNR4 family protein n=1 Tax=Limnoglobus roseus TaxID=2598579 RepID=A0A5C1ABW9_9BACT|nr:hypothetical protein [Limnoglobus roseus]QEL15292.1 SMI1/KNR4 family protein [Limnoglobus roseus]
MTEEEWLTAVGPESLLKYLGAAGSERKLRLFGILCCQQNDDLFRGDKRLLGAIELAQRFVEGGVTEQDRAAVESEVYDAWEELHFDELDDYLQAPATLLSVKFDLWNAEWCASLTDSLGSEESGFPGQKSECDAELADYLRDIFGSPFRSVATDPRWLTPTAVGIAQGIYADRAFDRLPILADALQDAGCEDADILAHCRGDGPHVRGCWVVDLVLGKS